MKKIIILILTIFVFNSFNLFAEIIIHGKVLSSTNQPLKRADVWVKNSNRSSDIFFQTQCEKDGSFKIILPNNFNSVVLAFSAVDHLATTFDVLVSPNSIYEINATINPYHLRDDCDTVFVVGDFNNFDFTCGIIPMNKNENGIYSVKIQGKNDTLAYQILVKESSAPQRIINGENSIFFTPDRDSDYISYLVNETKEFEIFFDRNKFRNKYPEPKLTSNSPAFNEYQNAKKIAGKIYLENILDINAHYEILMVKEDIESWNRIVDSIKQASSEKVVAAFYNVQHKESKIILAQNYIEIFQHFNKIPQDISFVNSDIVNFWLDSIDINSNFWYRNSGFYFWACLLSGESYAGGLRLENFLEAHKKTDATAGLYQKIIYYAMGSKKDTITAKKYFARMKEEFPEHIATIATDNSYNFSGTKKIVVGKIIPDFELDNLELENGTISMQSLRGKYVLLHIWGTWCAPCIENLSNLVDAFERLSHRNFTIYSIAFDQKNNVIKFRENNKMPWLHSALRRPSLDNETMQLLEIRGVPTIILVSPEGEILWVSIGTGAGLTETIEKFLQP